MIVMVVLVMVLVTEKKADNLWVKNRCDRLWVDGGVPVHL